jgi:hypothetical protein
LASAWYYVLGVLDEDRALSRAAAAMFVGCCIAAVVYVWEVR